MPRNLLLFTLAWAVTIWVTLAVLVACGATLPVAMGVSLAVIVLGVIAAVPVMTAALDEQA